MPLFSVIIPTYGRPRYLAEAVTSVLAQSVADLECLVVDDAGPMPPEAHPDPRVRIVHRATNGGPAAARNTGLEQALGRYVTFLDDDDTFTPDRLEMALEGLARADVALCNRVDSMGSEGGNRVLDGNVHDVILDSMTPHLGQVALRREIAPRFDERLRGAEDVEWWLRTARHTTVTTIPRTGLVYRVHEGPRHTAGVEARIQGSLDLLSVHAGYFRAHRRASAFRWKRIGLMAARAGDRRLARLAFLRALRRAPDASTAWHLMSSCRPGGPPVDDRDESKEYA